MLPSIFICRDFFSFCPFNRVRSCFQARGLARGLAMSACTRWSAKKEYVVWALSINQLKVGCGSTTPLSLRKFHCGIILIREKNETSGWQNSFWMSCYKLVTKFLVFLFIIWDSRYMFFQRIQSILNITCRILCN